MAITAESVINHINQASSESLVAILNAFRSGEPDLANIFQESDDGSRDAVGLVFDNRDIKIAIAQTTLLALIRATIITQRPRNPGFLALYLDSVGEDGALDAAKVRRLLLGGLPAAQEGEVGDEEHQYDHIIPQLSLGIDNIDGLLKDIGLPSVDHQYSDVLDLDQPLDDIAFFKNARSSIKNADISAFIENANLNERHRYHLVTSIINSTQVDSNGDLKKRALTRYLNFYVANLDLSDSDKYTAVNDFVTSFNRHHPQQEAAEAKQAYLLDLSGEKQEALIGFSCNVGQLPDETGVSLYQLLSSKLTEHNRRVEDSGEYEPDAEFHSRIMVPSSIMRTICGAGFVINESYEPIVSVPSDEEDEDDEEDGHVADFDISSLDTFDVALNHLNYLVRGLIFQPDAPQDLDIDGNASALQVDHRSLIENSGKAAETLARLIQLLDEKITHLPDDAGEEHAKLLIARQALVSRQTFFEKLKSLHEKRHKNLDTQTASRDAKAAYANAVFRSNDDWSNLVSHARDVRNGSISLRAACANFAADTTENFKLYMGELKQQEGFDVSDVKTSQKGNKKHAACDVTYNGSKVSVEHISDESNSSSELRVTSTSVSSLVKVLAAEYKIKLQQERNLNAQGNPVNGFEFSLGRDQVELSHAGDGNGTSTISALEREQFLTQLDRAFRSEFGPVYTGMVEKSALAASIKTPEMQQQASHSQQQLWRRQQRSGMQGDPAPSADELPSPQ